MGIRKHDKKDDRYADPKIKITHKGLIKSTKKVVIDKLDLKAMNDCLVDFYLRQNKR